MTIEQRVNEANQKVMDILLNGRPVWKDVRPALEAIPGMTRESILVAGPPLPAEKITQPIRTSICGAAVHEKLAVSLDEAWQMVLDGRIKIKPAQDYACGCAACMVVSASMPVIVAEDTVYGGKGYAPIHPGANPKVLRWGLYDGEVEQDLCWMRDEFGPALGQAVRASGGIDLVTVLAKTAGMGDENHNRQPAASMYLALQIIPHFMDVEHPKKNDMVRFLAGNDRFFLHVMMAGVEALTVKAKEIPLSTVMAGMGGNGVEFGIRISGMGDEWFTAPVNTPQGLYFTGYDGEDACPDMGDSAITETFGVGGMAMIAAPAVTRFVGAGGYEDALRTSTEMTEITIDRNPNFIIPNWNFQGTCLGIDARLVVEKGITPVINTGIAHKVAGYGQIGAGTVHPPIACFEKAIAAYAKKLGFSLD